MLRNASTSSGGESLSKEGSKLDIRKASTVKTPTEVSRRESTMATASTPISKPPSSGFNGASLVGLLASKRFAKRLTSRFLNNRAGSMMSSRLSGMGIKREPTYRMEPYKKFDTQKVEKIIENVISDKLNGYKYNPKLCAVMSKLISEEIRDKVKALHFDRYKIVAIVVIGEKKNQDILSCSRSIWDDQVDSYASYNYQTEDILCTVTVYGIYFE